MDDLEIAAMLCSLMCHDLVSPVGAIANGVEILEEEDDKKIHSQALGLLSHSAEEASFRLQFFRLAFGASGGIGAEINLDEAKRVLEGFYLNGKINLNWDAPSQSLEKTVVKLLLNLVHVGGESLSRGGSLGVDVMMEGEGEVRETRISVQANGKNAALKENFKDLLTGDASLDDLTTRTVQPYYTYRLAHQLNAKIDVDDSTDDKIILGTHILETAHK